MSAEYRYFKVTGGAVMAAHGRWMARHIQQVQARREFAKEFGADGTFANQKKIVGLVFEDASKVPAGWKKIPNDQKNVFRPSGIGSAKVLRRMNCDYPLADWLEFQTEVVGGQPNPFLFMENLRIKFMVFQKIGEALILLVPNLSGGDSNGKWTPPDQHCAEIKTSEYWLLKEAAGQS